MIHLPAELGEEAGEEVAVEREREREEDEEAPHESTYFISPTLAIKRSQSAKPTKTNQTAAFDRERDRSGNGNWIRTKMEILRPKVVQLLRSVEIS